ncbi:hypothetical protein [Microvirga makkahensis]|uniref:Uncharacterized protein n=1 Tax=Microvirga makkahensis TaxID=1128670 RepID=A0A7X3SNJ8_9HYPH|nr:hypothetical protein [Microvirga makkahensis]MXQ11481.1 hypothetical protein [Microvirga makkahensis]
MSESDNKSTSGDAQLCQLPAKHPTNIVAVIDICLNRLARKANPLTRIGYISRLCGKNICRRRIFIFVFGTVA